MGSTLRLEVGPMMGPDEPTNGQFGELFKDNFVYFIVKLIYI